MAFASVASKFLGAHAPLRDPCKVHAPDGLVSSSPLQQDLRKIRGKKTTALSKRFGFVTVAQLQKSNFGSPPSTDLSSSGSLSVATSHMVRSAGEDLDTRQVQRNSNLSTDLKSSSSDMEFGAIGGFSTDTSSFGYAGSEAQVFSGSPSPYRPRMVWFAASEEEERQFIDRAINAAIVGAAGAFALTKVLTVDRDYWHGWTLYEILRYAPIHNWSAYEASLKENPVLAKMMISGIVYSSGDWMAQCYEGKPILDIDRKRVLRSGMVGFCLHGSLSHFYYELCEALFPFKDWWAVPLKVAFDQTIWSGFWNSTYFLTLGLLRFESPLNIFSELCATFWPLLTAGWKLWPFAHVITYGIIPVEQRLLWVDIVELVWVTILSMYSNEKAEARLSESAIELPLECMPSMEAIKVEENDSKHYSDS